MNNKHFLLILSFGFLSVGMEQRIEAAVGDAMDVKEVLRHISDKKERALYAACQKDNLKKAEEALYWYPYTDYYPPGGDHTTALMFACQHGNLKLVILLLEYNAWVDAVNWHGKTALMYACKKGNPHIVKILLDKGAKVNVYDKKGMTPLMIACTGENLKIPEILLEFGAKVNHNDFSGKRALTYACEKENVELVISLLLYGAQIPQGLDSQHLANCTQRPFVLDSKSMALIQTALDLIAQKRAEILCKNVPNELIPYDVMGVVTQFLPPSARQKSGQTTATTLPPPPPPAAPKVDNGWCSIS